MSGCLLDTKVISPDETGFRNLGVAVINPFANSKAKGN